MEAEPVQYPPKKQHHVDIDQTETETMKSRKSSLMMADILMWKEAAGCALFL
tara:strand:+ start:522 stop:677 length:156 start_codon:yes stop_codon:yes gene_type:complete